MRLDLRYSREMDDSARKRRALARDLDHATTRQELLLYYQLQTTLNDGKICGAEALMPLAAPETRHGLAGRVHSACGGNRSDHRNGRMALRAACRDAARAGFPAPLRSTCHLCNSAARISPR